MAIKSGRWALLIANLLGRMRSSCGGFALDLKHLFLAHGEHIPQQANMSLPLPERLGSIRPVQRPWSCSFFC